MSGTLILYGPSNGYGVPKITPESLQQGINAALAATVVQAQAGAVNVAGSTMLGNLGLSTQDTLVSAGNSQATATILNAQLCIARSCPPGTAFILPTVAQVGVLAPITFRNKDDANNGLIYPPIGGQIDSYGTNGAVQVGPGSETTFIPGTTVGQWWA